ncbi:MAG TPA: histidine kinase [Gemmatimonadaceae bacterium]|nr:histidine kinase [Gemmatimonadaceae bacterium]
MTAFAVCALWALVAVLWGAQTALGAAVRGADPVALTAAIRSALRQVIPWIPVTLAIIALTTRYPLTGGTWRRHAPIHLIAALLLSFVANVLVVLMFWADAGRFDGIGALMQQGAIWGTVQFHITLVLYVAVLGITQAVLHNRAARDRKLQLARMEGQLAQARLEALNAQIRPHFLFNALHTIGQLWRSGRSDEADAMLDHLGGLFHRVMSTSSRLTVPLADELELVNAYLAIEQARFRDRLRPTISATPEALECQVPSLILQPIVENAVRHGVSAVSRAGRVEVTAYRNGARLTIAVRDDGPGISATPAHPGSGTGLRNTRERLVRLYGDAGRVVIADAAGGGTIVTLEIPVTATLAPDGHPDGNGARGA